MEKIHLKFTFFMNHVFGFLAGMVFTAWLLSFSQELTTGKYVLVIIAGGISLGVLIPKEIFQNALGVQETDTIFKKAPCWVIGILFAIVTIVSSLASYLILSPLYCVYFLGYLFGKGFNTAHEHSKGEHK